MLSGLSNTINSENTVYASPKPGTVPQHCMKEPVRDLLILVSQFWYLTIYMLITITTVQIKGKAEVQNF